MLKPLWYIAAGWVFLPFALRNFTSTALGHMEGFLRALRDSPPPEVIPRPPSATATAGDAQAPTEGAKSSIKIGVAGFCWGGRYAILLAGPAGSGASSGGEKLVDCVFAAHPSLVSVPQDVRAVTGTVPVSIANGPDDEWMGRKKMDELRRLLLEEPKVAGQGALAGGESVHEVVVYEGARHGFAIRGDPNDPRQAEMGMQAEDQAVAWFRKHLT